MYWEGAIVNRTRYWLGTLAILVVFNSGVRVQAEQSARRTANPHAVELAMPDSAETVVIAAPLINRVAAYRGAENAAKVEQPPDDISANRNEASPSDRSVLERGAAAPDGPESDSDNADAEPDQSGAELESDMEFEGYVEGDQVFEVFGDEGQIYEYGIEYGGYPAGDIVYPCMPCQVACDAPAWNGWVQAEYLMWWPRPMRVPPLVTSGTAESEGVIGQPGTEILLGGNVLDQMFSGARFRLGWWVGPCRDFAVEADGFWIGEATDSYSFSGSGAEGTGVIARPFFSVLESEAMPNGGEDSEWVAYPEQLRGTVTVEATSRMYGVGVRGMHTFCCCEGCGPDMSGCGCNYTSRRVMGFVGWRYLNLSEGLRINENLTSLLPAPDDGQFLIEDRFATKNSFNGVDLGAVWKGRRGSFSLDVLMRLAVGANAQRVTINGSTTLRGSEVEGNDFENATGGLLAQRTNIGEYSRNQFTMVPELGLTLGYALTPRWQATVGYTLLYWSNVVRPGDQIDRDVNPNLLPPEAVPFTGLARPEFSFVQSDLWVNGLSVGLEHTW